jgi:hypothetical protein
MVMNLKPLAVEGETGARPAFRQGRRPGPTFRYRPGGLGHDATAAAGGPD